MKILNYRYSIMAPTAAAALIIMGACAADQTAEIAAKRSAEDISRLTAERNLYRDLSDRAHALLTHVRYEEKRLRSQAYATGVKAGAAGVKCIPVWEPVPEK